jgi:hypothetical protein
MAGWGTMLLHAGVFALITFLIYLAAWRWCTAKPFQPFT